jgi:ribosome-binding protein aMBF1 (putative translation factor)
VFVYPRLPQVDATAMLEDLRAATQLELRAAVDPRHPAAIYAPIGSRVPTANLLEIRELICTIADAHGYPKPPGTTARQAFDSFCAEALHSLMDIPSTDAADDGVWAYLACVLLPDIACWRFDDRAAPRLLGGPRNTFRRLWTRARALVDPGAPEPYALLHALNEDETVQIMERPTLGANPTVAVRMARAFVTEIERRPDVPRMTLMREAAKRLIRLTPFVSVDSLTEDSLEGVMGVIMSRSALALAGEDAEPAGDDRNGETQRSPNPATVASDVAAIADSPRRQGLGRRPRDSAELARIAEFSRRLRLARISRGFSFDDLAELCDVAAGSLRAYESNGRYPQRPQRARIAQALDVSLDWLEGELARPDRRDDVRRGSIVGGDSTQPSQDA